jgi:hypothetical protein
MDNDATTTRSRFAYRVVPIGDAWKVALPGDSVAVSVHDHKATAIARALDLARRGGGLDVLVCRPDGSIETEFSTRAT